VHVRQLHQLKKNGAPLDKMSEAVAALQALKLSANAVQKMYSKEEYFNCRALDDLILQKMFVIPPFEIHGGVRSLYDLRPPACTLKVLSFLFCAYSFTCV